MKDSVCWFSLYPGSCEGAALPRELPRRSAEEDLRRPSSRTLLPLRIPAAAGRQRSTRSSVQDGRSGIRGRGLEDLHGQGQQSGAVLERERGGGASGAGERRAAEPVWMETQVSPTSVIWK